MIFSKKDVILFKHFNLPVWWNWQTRGTQNPVVAIPCGFDPHHRHHVGTSYACSDFFVQKNRSLASLFLLFRKRSRSSRLFACKRAHNAFVSLPTFYESVPLAHICHPNRLAFPENPCTIVCGFFTYYLFTFHYSLKGLVDFWKVISNSE